MHYANIMASLNPEGDKTYFKELRLKRQIEVEKKNGKEVVESLVPIQVFPTTDFLPEKTLRRIRRIKIV